MLIKPGKKESVQNIQEYFGQGLWDTSWHAKSCIMVEVTNQHGFHKNKNYQYHKSPEISILSLPLSFACPVHGDMAEHPVCIS